ncbi:MAG: C_GCAxxG_C_C family protein [Candidatus Lokiarchaeota archaeon]|nr:C_GCAxxG_C_C family protein [Candidatus Lokiarchaeota archaeon]
MEEQLKKLEQKAGDYEQLFQNCAQGTLLALQEHFGLGDSNTLKAATAFPGIALRGETCGAVIGSIMALGLAFGRDKPEDLASLQRTISAARKLCHLFEKEFGSCNCRDVQHCLFGRNYDLMKLKDQQEFIKSGDAKKCRIAVGKAARITGEIILNGLE